MTTTPAAESRPLLRGVLHQAAFDVSLVAGTLLIMSAAGAAARAASAVYASSLSGLLGVSATYHRGRWRPAVKRVMQRLDHMMIFVLIAGTYTPVAVVALRGTGGVLLLVAVWVATITALVVHMIWLDAPERLVGGVYLGLGWLAVVAMPALWHRLPAAGFALLVAGGALYTAGAVAYTLRRPDPSPRVYGYHEVFHTFVVLAAACHFVMIAFFLG